MKPEEKDAQGADGGPGRVSAGRPAGGSCARTRWNVRAQTEKRGHGTRRTTARPPARRAPRPACLETPRGARRAAITGPFSFMKGKMPNYLSLDEHLALGVNLAWFSGFTHRVIWAAMWDFMKDYQSRGTAAWDDFVASRADHPFPTPYVGPEGEGEDKQRELEQRYFSGEMLKKYQK